MSRKCQVMKLCTPPVVLLLMPILMTYPDPSGHSLQVAEQLCRLLTGSTRAHSRAVLGERLERLPLALQALAEVMNASEGGGVVAVHPSSPWDAGFSRPKEVSSAWLGSL